MDEATRENWRLILKALEANGKGDSMFAKRAREIIAGRPDLLWQRF